MSDLVRIFTRTRYNSGLMFSVPRNAVGDFIALLSTGLEVESTPDYNQKFYKMAEDPEAMDISVVPESRIKWPTPPEPEPAKEPLGIEEAKKQLSEGES